MRSWTGTPMFAGMILLGCIMPKNMSPRWSYILRYGLISLKVVVLQDKDYFYLAPPGTGKTTIGKAIDGEAKATFFYISRLCLSACLVDHQTLTLNQAEPA